MQSCQVIKLVSTVLEKEEFFVTHNHFEYIIIKLVLCIRLIPEEQWIPHSGYPGTNSSSKSVHCAELVKATDQRINPHIHVFDDRETRALGETHSSTANFNRITEVQKGDMYKTTQ